MNDAEREDLGTLAAKAAAGEAAALDRLLGRLVGPLREYLATWLGNRREAHDEAQDLAQEVLLRVVRGIGGCRARTDRQVMAWALTIARRVGLDYLKSERRRLARCEVWPDLEEAAVPASVDAWAAAAAGPGSWEGGLPAIAALVHETLPEPTKHILWMRVAENGTWRDIAGETNLTLRAVQRRFQRFCDDVRDRAATMGSPDWVPP